MNMAGPKADTMDKKYMAECDLRTLIEAQRIKKDGKRYKAAMAAHADQMKALMGVEAEKKKA